jgi:hypothetical protein
LPLVDLPHTIHRAVVKILAHPVPKREKRTRTEERRAIQAETAFQWIKRKRNRQEGLYKGGSCKTHCQPKWHGHLARDSWAGCPGHKRFCKSRKNLIAANNTVIAEEPSIQNCKVDAPESRQGAALSSAFHLRDFVSLIAPCSKLVPVSLSRLQV